jgi:hypothetical protein
VKGISGRLWTASDGIILFSVQAGGPSNHNFYFKKKKFVKVKMVLGPLLPHVLLPMLAYRCYSFFVPQLETLKGVTILSS